MEVKDGYCRRRKHAKGSCLAHFNRTLLQTVSIAAGMASILPALRQAAPRLTRQLFECSHRPALSLPKRSSSDRKGIILGLSLRQVRPFKSSPRRVLQAVENGVQGDVLSSSPVASVIKSTSRNVDVARSGWFPKTSEKAVAYWLLGSAASVFGIVVFGGLTRLTESG